MRKGFWMVLAVALVAVLAAPAVAGTDINGFYRAKGYVSNFKTGASTATVSNDMASAAFVEQRFRVRFAFGEENVKAVWFSEIDFTAWGDTAGSVPSGVNGNFAGAGNPAIGWSPSGAQRNSGGALGGDRINLETKNLYVWFKLPNTSLDFTVGLQNQSDTFFGLLYGGADMGAIFATGKYEPVSWKLGWAKLYENNTQKWDDLTLYVGQVNFAPMKDLKLGFGLYVLQDDTQKAVIAPTAGTVSLNLPLPVAAGDENTKLVYTPGIDFAWNAGPVALSGFFLYQFGTIEAAGTNTDPDIDISAFAVDLRADANLGPGKLFVEGLYISGSDLGGTNPDYESVVTLSDVNASPGGNSAFTRLDYSILMGNADDINTNQCLIGCAAPVGGATSPGNGGRGMWTIGAGYSMKVASNMSFKVGAGYLAATDMLATDAATRDNDMGTEVNGNFNYNIMKGLDLGLYAAYAWLGDFYKAGTVTDPDDAFDVHFRLNYAF